MVKQQHVHSLIYIVFGLLILFSVVNVSLLAIRSQNVQEAMALTQELLRPAVLTAVKIMPTDCRDCYDVEQAYGLVKRQNVNITEEEALSFDSRDAKALITKYKIEKLPAIVLSGEVNKTEQLRRFFESNGLVFENVTAVYTNIRPPYYAVKSNQVLGRVTVVTLDDSACKDCKRLSDIVTFLKQAGVGISKSVTYEYDSSEGKEYVQKYGVNRIPALLISKDILHYPEIQKQLEASGAELRDDFYATHSTTPPYRDIKENRIVGLVTLTLLADKSCEKCYDVGIHKTILQRMGLAIREEKRFDISSPEGKSLVEKYSITKAPTAIISGDVGAYDFFKQIWPQAGSVEEDGSYVFRHLSVLGPGISYKDLKTGEIIENKLPEQPAAVEEQGGEPL